MMRRRAKRLWWVMMTLQCLIVLLAFVAAKEPTKPLSQAGRGVYVMRIDGPINPATDDYLRTSIEKAATDNAQLLVLKLNTPGGLLPSMQTMVEEILESPIPIVVYVSPSGGGAISAGVFITMAGHVAVMAPGTTIGAAHPVTGGGQDIGGDMRAKIENFAVSLIKAISEQRGRNIKWAEEAVRESVAITDREALEENVIDFIASDLDKVLAELKGRTVNVSGTTVTLQDYSEAPRYTLEMTFRQRFVNILCDPNIAIMLGLGALLGIGIELYNPGGFLPGIVGVICLVLSLTAAQVVPINLGGLALLILALVFFVIELLSPAFGIWGGAGILCLIVGSIYFVDTDQVWSVSGFEVDQWMIGSMAAVVGACLLTVVYLTITATRRSVTTGQEGLVGKTGKAKTDFETSSGGTKASGKVHVMGEWWEAEQSDLSAGVVGKGESVKVVSIDGLVLTVVPDKD